MNLNMLALFGGLVEWWQILLLLVLIGLIVFYVMYRRKQM
jgi:type II secretory pathway component PulF